MTEHNQNAINFSRILISIFESFPFLFVFIFTYFEWYLLFTTYAVNMTHSAITKEILKI